MSKLVTHLANYIKNELATSIDSSPNDSLRIIFSAPPRKQITELFEILTSENDCLVLETLQGNVEVPVYLVDQYAEDPYECSKAARCTANYLVTIRNYDYPVWLALQEVGASTNASLSTAVKPLGVLNEMSNFNLWLNTSVIQYLIDQCLVAFGFETDEENIKNIKKALQFSLYEAWTIDERYQDKRTVWQLLEKLLGVSAELSSPYEVLAATLGLSYSRKSEFGSDIHLKLLKRISDLFQSNGIRGGLNEIESNADEKTLPHVLALRAHIENQGIIDASEFVKNSLQIYSPVTIESTSIPNWWYQLNIEAWLNLLDSNVESPITDKLKVKLSNQLIAVPKGLIPLVRDSVELEISIEEVERSVDIIIERSNGNAALIEIHSETIKADTPVRFTDADIPDHKGFVRYKVSVEGHAPVIVKVIVLDFYGSGIVALSSGSTKATHFKINSKARDHQNKKINRYECDLHLPGMGSHYLNLFTSKHACLNHVIKGYEIDAEHTDTIEREINRIDANHYSCLIETDEECHYEMIAYSPGLAEELPFRIYITADESKQIGATSEFDRLVMTHRASAYSTHSSPRVDPLNCRAMDLEMWMLENENSFKPLVLGPDYIENWRKPTWEEYTKFSKLTLMVDPRPPVDEFNVPSGFLVARNNVLALLGTENSEATPTASTLALYKFMQDKGFVKAMKEFLDEYFKWLESDYNNAVWSDIVSIHAEQSNSKALETTPYAIMLSPFHPIRLAWQCCAQEILQEALDKHSRCPAASVMNPTTFPDCLVLPCRTATGNIEREPFAAMTSSSDYWSVMWSVSSSNLQGFADGNSIFGDELGICVDGLASGFSAQQVVRSFDEVSRLMSAKSTLHIGVSSDTGGSVSCNEGIDIWCSANLGADEDDWQDAGPRSVVINDQRDSTLHPEQAVLASLTTRTDAAVRWFTDKPANNDQINDLSIIAHLSTMNHSFEIQGIRSAIDTSGLTRWRVRKQLPRPHEAFIAESRIGEISSNIDHDSLNGKLLSCVDEIESQCRDDFDSYIFAPDMAKLKDVVNRSIYTALSSSNVDAACFFGTTDKAYLWDYELPSYARRAGENSGYYLLAKESSGMIQAVRSALGLLGDNGEISGERISSLLEEISRRGMPTLKRLTTGGSMSFGEIGMLTALRLFQSEFERDAVTTGFLPVKDGETLNLIISADPFQKHFDDLRTAIGYKQGERPDLLIMSIKFVSGVPVQMRLTPIEVKARSDKMSPKKRSSALAQAKYFAEFLRLVQVRAEKVELWGIAWRNLLATMLDYSFRVYGQLDQFMKSAEWAKQHSAILRSIADKDLDIDVDTRGRLIVIEDSSDKVSLQDVDSDGFNETIVLTHAEAFSVLTRCDDDFSQSVNSKVGNWQLKPEQLTQSTISTENTDIDEVGDKDAKENNVSSKDAAILESTSDVKPQGIHFPVGKTANQFTSEELSFFPGNTALNSLNVGIVGDLGTGKTQLIQALVQQLTASPEMNRGKRPNILIFDYKRDYSKPDFVKATGARVISPYDIPLNLFDVRDSAEQNRAQKERSKFFIDVLDKIYTGIGPVQRQRIKSAVKSAYARMSETGGIAPTINDVFDAYKDEGGKPDTPYNIMDDLVDDGYFVDDSSKVVPFSDFIDGVVVIDLSAIGQDDRAKNILVVIFLNLFYEHMLRIEKKAFIGEDPKLRFVDTILLVDEADNIMQYEFDVLKKILLQGREFGVGVLLASQYLSHFKTQHENYLEPLLSWFIHKVPNVTVKELEGIGLTGVNVDIVDSIKSLKCHECLYKTLGVNGRVIRATPFFELMKSD